MSGGSGNGRPKPSADAVAGESPGYLDATTAPSADTEEKPSKSQRKRDAHALQALGEQLVALSPGYLARLDLPDALREAVLAARGMRSHGARLRQMQYIGRLMRELDPAALRTVREALEPGRALAPRPQSFPLPPGEG